MSDGGTSADGFSAEPSISGDGSLVAFYSLADNLVAGPPAAQADVYIRGPLH